MIHNPRRVHFIEINVHDQLFSLFIYINDDIYFDDGSDLLAVVEDTKLSQTSLVLIVLVNKRLASRISI
jgi:hypothetical protein